MVARFSQTGGGMAGVRERLVDPRHHLEVESLRKPMRVLGSRDARLLEHADDVLRIRPTYDLDPCPLLPRLGPCHVLLIPRSRNIGGPEPGFDQAPMAGAPAR